MFAKREWFKLARGFWGILPATWQGWAYWASWSAVIGLPGLYLIGENQRVESLIWLVVMSCLFAWERRDLTRQLRGENSPPVRQTVSFEAVPTSAPQQANPVRSASANPSQADVLYIGEDRPAGEEVVFRLRR